MIEEWRALSDLDDQLGINVFQEEAECAMVAWTDAERRVTLTGITPSPAGSAGIGEQINFSYYRAKLVFVPHKRFFLYTRRFGSLWGPPSRSCGGLVDHLGPTDDGPFEPK